MIGLVSFGAYKVKFTENCIFLVDGKRYVPVDEVAFNAIQAMLANMKDIP